MVPFAKTGGLADVSGALPKAIEKLGEDVTVIMPKYQAVDEKKNTLEDTGKKISVPISNRIKEAKIYKGYINSQQSAVGSQRYPYISLIRRNIMTDHTYTGHPRGIILIMQRDLYFFQGLSLKHARQ